MSQLTLEQLEKQYAINPHRAEFLRILREELDYWKAVSASLRVWIYGPYLGVAEQPEVINLLLMTVLKPADPAAPRRILRPQIQVHFRIGKDLVGTEEMVRTFNSLPQNIENNIRLDVQRVFELTL